MPICDGCGKATKWDGEWASDCVECGAITRHQRRVFPSLCDWLDEDVPIEWLADFLKLIHDTPNLDWLLLTKRPENFHRVDEAEDLLGDEAAEMVHAWASEGEAPKNVWIGVSCENQEYADKRILELLKIPAKIRFVSAEPLLGPIDFYFYQNGFKGEHYLDWVIIGGESGPKARPCVVEWIRDIVLQCKRASVPCFVKQLGTNPQFNRDSTQLYFRHKKGGEPKEWPEDLRVRQFPSYLEPKDRV